MKQLIDSCIDQFIISEEMRSYLKTTKIRPLDFVDMIYHAPSPLKMKLRSLKELLSKVDCIENAGERQEWTDEIRERIRLLEKALQILNENGVFSVETGYFDNSSYEDEYAFATLCLSYEEVLKTVHRLDGFIQEEEILRWYRIKKWLKNNEGKLQEACCYVMVKDDIWFCEMNDEKHPYNDSLFRCRCVNLPIPFRAGDILELDGYPFQPQIHALIVKRDNDDCCNWGIFRREDGHWHAGVLQCGDLAYDTSLRLSPLYKAGLVANLSKNDQLLKELRYFLAGNESVGKILTTVLSKRHNEVTDDVIREFIRRKEHERESESNYGYSRGL